MERKKILAANRAAKWRLKKKYVKKISLLLKPKEKEQNSDTTTYTEQFQSPIETAQVLRNFEIFPDPSTLWEQCQFF